ASRRTRERNATTAVSRRSVRGPRVTKRAPAFRNSSSSGAEKPPSGPIANASAGAGGSDSGARSTPGDATTRGRGAAASASARLARAPALLDGLARDAAEPVVLRGESAHVRRLRPLRDDEDEHRGTAFGALLDRPLHARGLGGGEEDGDVRARLGGAGADVAD